MANRYYMVTANGALLPFETEAEAHKMHARAFFTELESNLEDTSDLDYGKLVPVVTLGTDRDPTMLDDFIPEAIERFTPPLNGLAHAIWNVARLKGFRSQVGDVDLSTFVANLHGEVSELWEAHRSGQLHERCDKATSEPLTCAEEEIADIMIRTLDMAADLGVDVDKAVRVKLAYNLTRPFKHGKVC